MDTAPFEVAQRQGLRPSTTSWSFVAEKFRPLPPPPVSGPAQANATRAMQNGVIHVHKDTTPRLTLKSATFTGQVCGNCEPLAQRYTFPVGFVEPDTLEGCLLDMLDGFFAGHRSAVTSREAIPGVLFHKSICSFRMMRIRDRNTKKRTHMPSNKHN